MEPIRTKGRRHHFLPCVAGAAACLVSLPGLAQGPAPGTSLIWGVNAGLGFTDNIQRSPNNGNSETVALVGANIDLSHATRTLQASVTGDIGWEEYLEGSASGEVIGRVDATGLFTLIPDRLRWDIADSFGQVRTNPFEALTPFNRENVNYFTTGPQLALHLGDTSQAVIGARYTNTAYEISPYDSDRYGATFALTYATGPRRNLSLNALTERYEFADKVNNSNYDKQEYFGRFETSGSRTSLAADLGYTELHDASQVADGIIARVFLSRALSRRTNFTFNAGTEFSDAGNIFRNRGDFEAGGLDTAAVLATAAAFENRFVAAGWNLNRERTSVFLYVQVADEIYDTELSDPPVTGVIRDPGAGDFPLMDRTVASGRIDFGRRIRPLATLNVFAEGFSERFDISARDVDEHRFGVGLTWQLGRALGLTGEVARLTRDTEFGSADEHRITLRLAYLAGRGRFSDVDASRGTRREQRGVSPGGIGSGGRL